MQGMARKTSRYQDYRTYASICSRIGGKSYGPEKMGDVVA